MTEGRDVAVAFSGGLDSGVVAVLAGKYARSVKLYTVGAEGSYDVEAAKGMCQHLGMEWEHIVMDEDSLVGGLRETIRITGTTDPVTLSFEVPLMYILPHVKEEYVIGGQGADETLWGYSKYLDLPESELRAAAGRDMRTLKEVTQVHESKMAAAYGKTVLYPFLDAGVQDAVSGLDFDYMRPVGDDRKRPLKDASAELGHPEIAEKTKKAAQYGTGSMNMIKKLAKRNGQSVSGFISGLAEASAGDASSWMDGHDQKKIVLGLERVSELARRLGDPQRMFRVIHVAGSDGKGSVCTMIASVLRASGISTGLFTSPFLESRTESMSVDGKDITQAEMESLLEEVREAEDGIGCTYFEILTVTAFLWFARCGVEYAVIETGMGGTEDATNIVVPDVSVITNISREHTAFLGNTVGEIAAHKAGIIKHGAPSVTIAKGEALEVIRKRAEAVGSELTVAEAAEVVSLREDGSDVRYKGEIYYIGIPGSYQAENMAAAVEAVLRSSVSAEARDHIAEGIQGARLYARMEKVPGLPIVIDGTHTVAGMNVLCRDVSQLYGRTVTVFGVLEDKDAEGMSEPLSGTSDVIIVTAPASDRAMPADRLHGIVSRYRDDAKLVTPLEDALDRAVEISGGRTILITGSFRMAEGAIKWLRTRYARSLT